MRRLEIFRRRLREPSEQRGLNCTVPTDIHDLFVGQNGVCPCLMGRCSQKCKKDRDLHEKFSIRTHQQPHWGKLIRCSLRGGRGAVLTVASASENRLREAKNRATILNFRDS